LFFLGECFKLRGFILDEEHKKTIEAFLLIIAPSKMNVEKMLKLAVKGCWILTIFLCLLFFVFTLISLYQGKESAGRSDLAGFARGKAIALEKIGQGSLSLRPGKRAAILPDMSQEIVLLAKNVRPDLKSKEISFLFCLRSSGSEQRIKNGEVVFLSCDPQAGGSPVYRFSDKKTPLWIKPSFLDGNKVLIEVGLFLPSKDSEGFLEEKAQFVLQEESLKGSGKFQGEKWISSLQKARLWGFDVLLPKYNPGVGRKFKVEIPGSRGTVFCFMQLGDFLVWNGDAWIPIEDGTKAAGKPMAQVKSMGPRGLEFEVWNEEGFYPQEIKLEMQSSPRMGSLKPDQIPQSVRARTAHQVSCCFAKRRYLLKPGDWILKTSRGWKVLKRSLDIEEYLLHKIRGELCIFDSLVREQGKLIMKGYWVDEMRTQKQPFSIAVEGDRTTQRSERKEKKGISLKKAEGAVTTYLPFSPKEKVEGDGSE